MRANRKRDTKPEVKLRSTLHQRGLRFRKNWPIRTANLAVRADIVFTAKRVAVFVDGCFWHCCPSHGTTPRTNADYWLPKLARNVERDREVTEALQDEGWLVIRVWEHEDPVDATAAMVTLISSLGRRQPIGGRSPNVVNPSR